MEQAQIYLARINELEQLQKLQQSALADVREEKANLRTFLQFGITLLYKVMSDFRGGSF